MSLYCGILLVLVRVTFISHYHEDITWKHSRGKTIFKSFKVTMPQFNNALKIKSLAVTSLNQSIEIYAKIAPKLKSIHKKGLYHCYAFLLHSRIRCEASVITVCNILNKIIMYLF